MKTINAIVKVLTALATIAGAVYIIATYGDQIVNWAKEMLAKAPKAPAEVTVVSDAPADAEPAAEVTEQEAQPEEAAEVSSEEADVAVSAPSAEEENAPVADEADFEG